MPLNEVEHRTDGEDASVTSFWAFTSDVTETVPEDLSSESSETSSDVSSQNRDDEYTLFDPPSVQASTPVLDHASLDPLILSAPISLRAPVSVKCE